MLHVATHAPRSHRSGSQKAVRTVAPRSNSGPTEQLQLGQLGIRDRPHTGQLAVVSNPGIDKFFSEDTGSSPDLAHYLPHDGTVIVGGVAVRGDWAREPDPAVAEAILARCAEIEPLLRGAEVLEHRVGLRPTRPQIRVEAEGPGDTFLIHNYGHGGAGVSLSWGCAAEIRELVPPA